MRAPREVFHVVQEVMCRVVPIWSWDKAFKRTLTIKKAQIEAIVRADASKGRTGGLEIRSRKTEATV